MWNLVARCMHNKIRILIAETNLYRNICGPYRFSKTIIFSPICYMNLATKKPNQDRFYAIEPLDFSCITDSLFFNVLLFNIFLKFMVTRNLSFLVMYCFLINIIMDLYSSLIYWHVKCNVATLEAIYSSFICHTTASANHSWASISNL